MTIELADDILTQSQNIWHDLGMFLCFNGEKKSDLLYKEQIVHICDLEK